MPERAEVYLFTAGFKKVFPPGSTIKRIKPLNGFQDLDLPDEPLTVQKVKSKGKKTYITFTNEHALLVSYGMSGFWAKKYRKTCKYEFQGIRCGDEDNISYYWGCNRKLHCESIEYLSLDELNLKLSELGLDVYYAKPSDAEILALFSKKGRGRNIGSFLLDQAKISGIGNWMKSVILHILGISPHRSTKNMTDQEKIGCFWTGRKISHNAVRLGGFTVHNFRLDDNKKLPIGDVYPYDCHGPEVRCEYIGGRVTYWCPKDQH